MSHVSSGVHEFGASDGTEIWQWVLRVTLPVTGALAGLLIYWICFDDIYDIGVWRVLSALPLLVTLAAVALWTWHSWLPPRSSDHQA
jgi:hypothetical protein